MLSNFTTYFIIGVLSATPIFGQVINGSNGNVARVLWAEGASATPKERLYIASVMKNRIGHPGYGGGKLHTLEQVAYSKGEFICIEDDKNSQWKLTENSEFWQGNKKWTQIWIHCMVLSRGTFSPRIRATAYHDKSIHMPKSWKTNPYWMYVLEEETPNFKFYKVEPK